jgi:hypothetical protein
LHAIVEATLDRTRSPAAPGRCSCRHFAPICSAGLQQQACSRHPNRNAETSFSRPKCGCNLALPSRTPSSFESIVGLTSLLVRLALRWLAVGFQPSALLRASPAAAGRGGSRGERERERGRGMVHKLSAIDACAGL